MDEDILEFNNIKFEVEHTLDGDVAIYAVDQINGVHISQEENKNKHPIWVKDNKYYVILVKKVN